MEKRTRKGRILGQGASSQWAIMAVVALGFLLAQPARAQARVPLPVAADSSGVLSAIRAIDLRQLCRCPTLVLDSMVRRAPKVRMFDVLEERPAFVLSAAGVALVPPGQDARQVLILVGPPNGVAAGHLVGLEIHRAAWRVLQVRNVY